MFYENRPRKPTNSFVGVVNFVLVMIQRRPELRSSGFLHWSNAEPKVISFGYLLENSKDMDIVAVGRVLIEIFVLDVFFWSEAVEDALHTADDLTFGERFVFQFDGVP